jgi:hypothetical protein
LKRSTRAFLFTGRSGTGKTMAAEVIARISARHPYLFPGCAPFRRHWRNPHAFIWRFRAGFPALHQWKGIKKMKTFIVYDLDSQMPVAVGEQVSAETARYCASVATGIFPANLLAEEIDLEKQITY